ncbi:MAG: hypothetical protein AB1644_01300 [Candidatus Zixiibacteriota bacterium]
MLSGDIFNVNLTFREVTDQVAEALGVAVDGVFRQVVDLAPEDEAVDETFQSFFPMTLVSTKA